MRGETLINDQRSTIKVVKGEYKVVGAEGCSKQYDIMIASTPMRKPFGSTTEDIPSN